MTEQEIYQLCRKSKSIKPLLQAVRFGAIKFVKHFDPPAFTFGMRSKGGLITFEDDRYFFTKLNGEDLDRLLFANDPKGTKDRLVQELNEINFKIRGITR